MIRYLPFAISLLMYSQSSAQSNDTSDIQYYYSESSFLAHFTNDYSIMVGTIQYGDIDSAKSLIVESNRGVLDAELEDSNYYFTYTKLNLIEILEPGKRLVSGENRTYKRSTNSAGYRSRDIRYSPMAYDTDSLGQPIYDPQSLKRYTRNNRPRSRTYTSGARKSVRYDISVFTYYESFICVNEGKNQIALVNSNGDILSSNPIDITEPKIYSSKGKQLYFDQVSKDLYMVVKTNYGFNWYYLDPGNGEAELVLRIDEIWPNPKWQVIEGFLSYEKPVEGELKQFKNELAL